VYATYFNQSSALENLAMSSIFFETGSDGFLRKITPANFQAQLAISNFPGQVTNAQVPQSAVTQHSVALFTNAALTGTPTAPTAAAGTVSGQIATTAFANPPATLAQDGAARLPSGLAFRWGRTTPLGGGGTAIVFVTPFLVDIYNVQITAQNTGGVAQAADSATNKTVNGFTLNNAGSVARTFDYFATGRDA
jgi:LysM repeat protein